MKRNWYAIILLAIIALALYGCSHYVKASTDELTHRVQAAYGCTADGSYSEAAALYIEAANRCKRESPYLGLIVRRSLLDKVNETLSTLSYYATSDNQQDLGVETARACRQLEQLAKSFLGGF